MNIALSALATLAILGAIPLIVVVLCQQSDRAHPWVAIALTAAIGALVVCAAVAFGAGPFQSLLVTPVIALGALFAVLATRPLTGFAAPAGYVVAAVATALVFLPIAVLDLGPLFDPLSTEVGVLDAGAAFPLFIAGSATAIGLARMTRRGDPRTNVAPRGWRTILPTIALVVVWTCWLIAGELRIDSSTPIIVVNALLMPIAGAAAAALVERLRFRRNTAGGTTVGILAALAAATCTCPYVDPSLAVVTGLIAGAVCAVRPPRGMTSLFFALLVGGSIGAVLIGALATHFGFLHTGQPEVVFSQLLVTVIAAVLGGAVGLASGVVVARRSRVHVRS